MKKIILLTVLILGALQAESIVHYDTKDTKDVQTSKPNYPNDDLHIIK